MINEVVTHAEVMQWLPERIRRELEMAMSPEQRGWWTEAEAEADGGRFIETRRMEDAHSRFYKVGS